MSQTPNPPPEQPSPAAPKKKGNPVVGLIALVVIAGLCALGGVILFGGGNDKPADPVTADQSGTAEVMCHEFVKKQLKAPATAKFPAADSIKKDGATYTVIAGVDSENGFGALIRTPFTCVIHADGDDKWTLVDLKLQKV